MRSSCTESDGEPLKWDNIFKAPKPKERLEVPDEVEDDDEPEAPDFSHLAS